MKKSLELIVILAVVCLCLILTGCNSNNNPEGNLSAINTTNEENIGVVLPEGTKGSLTNEELNQIFETNFPISYTYTIYNFETKEYDSGEYIYPENLDYSLLIPEHATMVSREVISSAIEDGMIYTDTKVVLQDNAEIKVLYIVNPETMKLIAASVENGNETRNYQFAY